MTDENIVEQQEAGTLKIGEIHPAARSAFSFVKAYLMHDYKNTFILKEALASSALSGNRLSEICLTTLERILKGDAVSDRYLLGLAWVLKELEESKNEE